MSRKLQAAAVTTQVSAVILGHFFGSITHYPGLPPSSYTFFGLAGWILMLLGAGAAMRSSNRDNHRVVTTRGLVIYAAIVVLFEPFLDVGDSESILVAVLAIVPLLLAIGGLLRARAWMSLAGVTLFIFVCSAMLASNASTGNAGSGFFGAWFE